MADIIFNYIGGFKKGVTNYYCFNYKNAAEPFFDDEEFIGNFADFIEGLDRKKSIVAIINTKNNVYAYGDIDDNERPSALLKMHRNKTIRGVFSYNQNNGQFIYKSTGGSSINSI